MATGLHSQLAASEIHGPWRQVFADATARTSDAGPYTAADVTNRITALQLDTGQGYYLSNNSPVTWTEIGGMTTNDHGALSGLGDDDHTQYVLRSILTTNGDLFTRAAGVIARLGIGSDGQVLTAQSGAPAWVTPGSSEFDIRDIIVWDHFQSSSDNTERMGVMGWAEFGTGTGSDVDYTGFAGRPGVVFIQAGTGGGARRGIACGDDGGEGGRIFVGGTNPLVMEALVRFPAAGDVNSANLLQTMVGLGLNWQSDAEINNGIYFRLQPGSSANWFFVCANGGTRSTVDLNVAPTAGTWQRIGWTATPSSCQAYINGSAVGSAITTNIPTDGVGFGLKSRSNGGSGSRFECDYVRLTQVTDKEGA